jgi:hypothetical protein
MILSGMKILAVVSFVTIIASAPALGRTHTDDKLDCEKASGTWDWINVLAGMD